MYDPSNRRYLHPFINCTCCGPRMTILDALPYDRERTSMKIFPMCRPCSEEYYGAWSRRYDAQPVCCNDCGPEVYLLPSRADHGGAEGLKPGGRIPDGKELAENTLMQQPVRAAGRKTRGGVPAECIGREAITAARRTILAGGIVAVKGIGGFHLCCDATNEEAVQKLRTRKRRPAKPFAVMMRDEDTVLRECLLNREQRQILTGHQKPILLLDRQTGAGNCLLAPSVAPGNPKVGVMLPYAPLQHLLFRYDDGLDMPDCLVMTSGHVSGAPICRDDADALSELSEFCDCILSHDRLIRIRADDSVMDFHRGHPYMIRRSRGYAPLPVLLSGISEEKEGEKEKTAQIAKTAGDRQIRSGDPADKGPGGNGEDGTGTAAHAKGPGPGGSAERSCVLAVGGELKNTFCIGSGNLLYLSPYVGDLEDLRTVQALEETIGRMETLLEVRPGAVVCDLHPKYNATMVAEEIARKENIPLYRIQHHYAHVLSCMAENDRTEAVIGVSFDGTGYGTDGTIWGGEILTADFNGFTREYSIMPFLQTGGDSAPRQGWRIAASMIWSLCRDGLFSVGAPDPADRYFSLLETLQICDVQNAKVQRTMAERGIQAVPSTSAGRLFDAVSAMLGICRESTYEGEASIELEFAAERYVSRNMVSAAPVSAEALGISFPADSGQLPTDLLFAELLRRKLEGEDPEKLAWLFHAVLAGLIVEACARTSVRTGLRCAALSGGCYQNRLLLTLTEEGLQEKEMEVLLHHLVPPNDGGIALGQAVAVMMRRQGRQE